MKRKLTLTKNLDKINSSKIRKEYGLSEVFLYRCSINGKIKRYGNRSFSKKDIEDYITLNTHYKDLNNKPNIIDLKQMLPSIKVAKILYPNQTPSTGRRYLSKLVENNLLSYIKLGTRKFLYFPEEVKQLKKDIGPLLKKGPGI